MAFRAGIDTGGTCTDIENSAIQHSTTCHDERALEIGTKLFNLAEEWKLRTGANPCKFVRKYREHKRERFSPTRSSAGSARC